MNFTIVFDEPVLTLRGTSVAIYDYAKALEEYEDVRSIIIYDANLNSDKEVVEKFFKKFKVLRYHGSEERTKIVNSINPDLYYYLKTNPHDDRYFDGIKVATHCVFDFFPKIPASKFAYVSDWLSDFLTKNRTPVVPHIVDIPKANNNLRSLWKIPKTATVIGRHGGYDSFDIPFVYSAIRSILNKRQDLYFVLVNTNKFIEHDRVIFVQPIIDNQEKSNFIASCDAMLHARYRGESFGLAMAEFFLLDRPVFCWAGGRDRNHIVMQPNPHHIYKTYDDLMNLLMSVQRAQGDEYYKNAVELYRPKVVARKFIEVFVESCIKDDVILPNYRQKWRRRLVNRVIMMKSLYWSYLSKLQIML